VATAKITKRTVDTATPGARNKLLWDEEVSGFGLKVTPAGKKVYVYQYRLALPGQASRTPPRRYTIGTHGDLTPDQARSRAKELRALVDQGGDPLDDRRARIAAGEAKKRETAEEARRETEMKFEAVAERWLAHLLAEGKSSGYYATARWAMQRYLVPGLVGRAMPTLTPDDIQAVIDAVPAERRETKLALHNTAFAIFKWAKGTKGGRIVLRNVVEEVDRPRKPPARDRVLDDSEIALVWLAIEKLAAPWPAFFRLLILTGKRRSEVARIDWAGLDGVAREWTIPKTKSGNSDLIPLCDAVVVELDALAQAARQRAGEDKADGWPKSGPVLTADGRRPIGNFSKAKRLLDEAITDANDGNPLPHWTIHDLRRTLSTRMQRLGVRFEVTEALLNHTGRSKGGVAAVYQRHDWKEEKRDALAKQALHIEQVVAAAQCSNVVSLERREAS
jgi:integrase